MDIWREKVGWVLRRMWWEERIWRWSFYCLLVRRRDQVRTRGMCVLLLKLKIRFIWDFDFVNLIIWGRSMRCFLYMKHGMRLRVLKVFRKGKRVWNRIYCGFGGCLNILILIIIFTYFPAIFHRINQNFRWKFKRIKVI